MVQVDGKTIDEFLTLLDNIEQQFETLGKESPELRPERSRWESLLNRINSQPGPIVHAANVAGGMDKLRAAHPPAESFWWYLDREVTIRRIRSVRRLLTTVVTIVVDRRRWLLGHQHLLPTQPRSRVDGGDDQWH